MGNGTARFGQFLVESSVISSEHVVQALAIQRERRESFGRICLNLGKLTVAQVFEILNLQALAPHEMFGELCVELGFLSPDEVGHVLQVQQETRPPLGEILVEIGALDADRLDELVTEYEESIKFANPA